MGREATHAIGVVIDITHIKEKEEALHESERRLRLALDAAHGDVRSESCWH